jgi:hypothetical protein
MHARHFYFGVFRAGAFAVLDRLYLDIETGDFSETDPLSAPLYLEVKFGKWVCCHDKKFKSLIV